MPDTRKPQDDAALNAHEIEDVDATQDGPRGNVHSEPSQPARFEAPPPLDH